MVYSLEVLKERRVELLSQMVNKSMTPDEIKALNSKVHSLNIAIALLEWKPPS